MQGLAGPGSQKRMHNHALAAGKSVRHLGAVGGLHGGREAGSASMYKGLCLRRLRLQSLSPQLKPVLVHKTCHLCICTHCTLAHHPRSKGRMQRHIVCAIGLCRDSCSSSGLPPTPSSSGWCCFWPHPAPRSKEQALDRQTQWDRACQTRLGSRDHRTTSG